MDHDKILREHLIKLLSGKQAHIDPETALSSMPLELRGKRWEAAPHTPWQLLEHIRIAQWDILEFSRNPQHVSPAFPQGYWPSSATPPDEEAWNKSVSIFQSDLKAMMSLVADPATDLYTPIPHGTGQTILREALLVADHNAYHLGQFVWLGKVMGSRSEIG